MTSAFRAGLEETLSETHTGPLPEDSRFLAGLLDDVARFFRRFVVLTPSQTDILALFIVHTHAVEAADATPFIAVTSAEKRSGKTRLLEVAELLVRNPWRAVLPSDAVLVRRIKRDAPTLLLDEVDAIFGPKATQYETLRALLNAGNRRGATVDRCLEKGSKLESFPVFCPKVLAGIGRLPDTIADRSIPIRLQRRAPSTETIERFRFRDVESEATTIRNRLMAYATRNVSALREARPVCPEGLDDRAEDGAEPLLAIADMAGEGWPERARAALVAVFQARPDDNSLGVRLLQDIRSVFDAEGRDRFSSVGMCGALAELDEAPWGEMQGGKPIKPRALARLLEPYMIRSRSVRMDDGSTPKGYLRGMFEDAWSRLLPLPCLVTGSQSATPPQPALALVESGGGSKTAKEPAPQVFANQDGLCGGVAVDSSHGEKGRGRAHGNGTQNQCGACLAWDLSVRVDLGRKERIYLCEACLTDHNKGLLNPPQ